MSIDRWFFVFFVFCREKVFSSFSARPPRACTPLVISGNQLWATGVQFPLSSQTPWQENTYLSLDVIHGKKKGTTRSIVPGASPSAAFAPALTTFPPLAAFSPCMRNRLPRTTQPKRYHLNKNKTKAHGSSVRPSPRAGQAAQEGRQGPAQGGRRGHARGGRRAGGADEGVGEAERGGGSNRSIHPSIGSVGTW